MEYTKLIKVKCPLCGGHHDYPIVVRTTVLAYFGFRGSRSGREETSFKLYRRIFTCPDKNKLFEATIKIEKSSGERINDVHIKRNEIGA